MQSKEIVQIINEAEADFNIAAQVLQIGDSISILTYIVSEESLHMGEQLIEELGGDLSASSLDRFIRQMQDLKWQLLELKGRMRGLKISDVQFKSIQSDILEFCQQEVETADQFSEMLAKWNNSSLKEKFLLLDGHANVLAKTNEVISLMQTSIKSLGERLDIIAKVRDQRKASCEHEVTNIRRKLYLAGAGIFVGAIILGFTIKAAIVRRAKQA